MFQSLGISFYMVVKLSALVSCGQGNRGSESRDISCGLEPLSILLVNDNKHQTSPTNFQYITESKVGSGVDITAVTASADIHVKPGHCLECNPGCKRHVCPCGLDMGEHYYYSADGSLNEAWSEIPRGNSVAFIRECNEKCGCPTSCSNRVVQRGMTHAFEVIYDIHYIL
jgi:hypothetical protein